MLRATTLLLANRKRLTLAIVDAARDAREIRFRVTGEGFASLQYYLNDTAVEPLPSTDSQVHLPLPPTAAERPVHLAVFGCDEQGKILVNARANFAPSESS